MGGGHLEDRVIHPTLTLPNPTHSGYFDYDLKSQNPKSPLNPWAFIPLARKTPSFRAEM